MPYSAETPPRILLADADHQARAEAAAYLREHTLEVVELDALPTEDALSDDFALVVADVTLGAEEAEAWLGEWPTARRPKVIFTSNNPSIPGAVRAMKAGAEDFLPKPLLLPTLLQRVRDALPAAPSSATDVMPLLEVERDAIRRALVRTGGNVRSAAAALGVPRSTLYERIAAHGLNGARAGRPPPKRGPGRATI